MLEGLDEISWSQLEHAYGDASDVPVLIRQLLSKDNAIVDKAVYELFGNIWHQGTVYEASATAVPFLQEVFKLPEINAKTRKSLACLLASMADGYDIKDGSYAAETRIAVEKEVQLLFPYLFCDVPVVRESVAGALSRYPQYVEETLPMLEKALASESDQEAKEKITEAIEKLKSEQAKL
jgi:hypothetical protein